MASVWIVLRNGDLNENICGELNMTCGVKEWITIEVSKYFEIC